MVVTDESEVSHDNDHDGGHLTDFQLALLLVSVGLFLGSATRFTQENVSKLKIPYTVVLFIIGIILALIEEYLGKLGTAVHQVKTIDPHMLLGAFIPALIFESAFSVNYHTMIRIFFQALLLAGPGVIINTSLTALFSRYVLPYDWTWSQCTLFGSIVSATDPVAVVSLLRELGASKRLATLIEGESLLNDGTAFVLYMIALEFVKGENPGTGGVITQFLQLAIVGSLIGVAFGLMIAFWLRTVFNDSQVEITITIFTCYLCFFVAEIECKSSGVLACVFLGLVLSKYKLSISPQVEHSLHHVWEILGFVATTLIFVFGGIIICDGVTADGAIDPTDTGYLILIYLYIHFTRIISMSILWYPLKKTGYGITLKDSIILCIGGLRGVIGLALALLTQLESLNMSSEKEKKFKYQIMFHTSGIVFLTLLINAVAMKYVVQYLGLDKPSKEAEIILRDAMEHLRQATKERIEHLKGDYNYSGADWSKVILSLPNYAEILNIGDEDQIAGQRQTHSGSQNKRVRATNLENANDWDSFKSVSSMMRRSITAKLHQIELPSRREITWIQCKSWWISCCNKCCCCFFRKRHKSLSSCQISPDVRALGQQSISRRMSVVRKQLRVLVDGDEEDPNPQINEDELGPDILRESNVRALKRHHDEQSHYNKRFGVKQASFNRTFRQSMKSMKLLESNEFKDDDHEDLKVPKVPDWTNSMKSVNAETSTDSFDDIDDHHHHGTDRIRESWEVMMSPSEQKVSDVVSAQHQDSLPADHDLFNLDMNTRNSTMFARTPSLLPGLNTMFGGDFKNFSIATETKNQMEEQVRLHSERQKQFAHRILNVMKMCYLQEYDEGSISQNAATAMQNAVEIALDYDDIELQHEYLLGFFKISKFFQTTSTCFNGRYQNVTKHLLLNKLSVAVEVGTVFISTVKKVKDILSEVEAIYNSPLCQDLVEQLETQSNVIREEWLCIQQSYPELYRAIQTRHACQHMIHSEGNNIEELRHHGLLDDTEHERLIKELHKAQHHLSFSMFSKISISAEDKKTTLLHLPFCNKVAPRQYHLKMAYLLDHAVLSFKNRKEFIFEAGETAKGIYILVRGTAVITMDGEVKDTKTSGSILAWEYLVASPFVCTLEAQTSVEYYFIPDEVVQFVIEGEHEATVSLWKTAATNLILAFFRESFSEYTRVNISSMVQMAIFHLSKEEETRSIRKNTLLIKGNAIDATESRTKGMKGMSDLSQQMNGNQDSILSAPVLLMPSKEGETKYTLDQGSIILTFEFEHLIQRNRFNAMQQRRTSNIHGHSHRSSLLPGMAAARVVTVLHRQRQRERTMSMQGTEDSSTARNGNMRNTYTHSDDQENLRAHSIASLHPKFLSSTRNTMNAEREARSRTDRGSDSNLGAVDETVEQTVEQSTEFGYTRNSSKSSQLESPLNSPKSPKETGLSNSASLEHEEPPLLLDRD